MPIDFRLAFRKMRIIRKSSGLNRLLAMKTRTSYLAKTLQLGRHRGHFTHRLTVMRVIQISNYANLDRSICCTHRLFSVIDFICAEFGRHFCLFWLILYSSVWRSPSLDRMVSLSTIATHSVNKIQFRHLSAVKIPFAVCVPKIVHEFRWSNRFI